jgi:hypothetical protein
MISTCKYLINIRAVSLHRLLDQHARHVRWHRQRLNSAPATCFVLVGARSLAGPLCRQTADSGPALEVFASRSLHFITAAASCRNAPHSHSATLKSPRTRDRITTPSAFRLHVLLSRASCQRARSSRPDDSSETYRSSVASRSIANITYTRAIEPSEIAKHSNHNGRRAHSPRAQEPYAGRRTRAQPYVDFSKCSSLVAGPLELTIRAL